MSDYEKFLIEVNNFEKKWGKAPKWAYQRLKKLEKEEAYKSK